jgi:hypothetical protein
MQIKSDMDKARKAAMKLAIWLTLSLFIGAFSASLAATEGGGLRDGTWSKHPFRISPINRQTIKKKGKTPCQSCFGSSVFRFR